MPTPTDNDYFRPYLHGVQLYGRRAYDHRSDDNLAKSDVACADYLRARGHHVNLAADNPNPIGDCGPDDDHLAAPDGDDRVDPAAFRLVYDYVVKHARDYKYATFDTDAAYCAGRDALVAYDDRR